MFSQNFNKKVFVILEFIPLLEVDTAFYQIRALSGGAIQVCQNSVSFAKTVHASLRGDIHVYQFAKTTYLDLQLHTLQFLAPI